MVEENKPLPRTPPEPKGGAIGSEGYKPAESYLYKAEFDLAIKWIKESMGNINFIMGVVIVVLFVGFLSLLVAVLSIFFQWNGMSAGAQSDLKKAIIDQTESSKQITNTLNDINSTLDKLKLLIPSPIQEPSSTGK